MRRFSIRTVLVATALVAVLLLIPIRRASTQKRGREWVASQQGHVTFDFEHDAQTDSFVHNSTTDLPDWLVHWFGVDMFYSVESVTLDNTLLEDLSPIADLQSLRYLAIIIEIDADLDFGTLCKLPHLEHLFLDYTNISAERLAEHRTLLPNVRVDATNHPPPD